MLYQLYVDEEGLGLVETKLDRETVERVADQVLADSADIFEWSTFEENLQDLDKDAIRRKVVEIYL